MEVTFDIAARSSLMGIGKGAKNTVKALVDEDRDVKHRDLKKFIPFMKIYGNNRVGYAVDEARGNVY